MCAKANAELLYKQKTHFSKFKYNTNTLLKLNKCEIDESNTETKHYYLLNIIYYILLQLYIFIKKSIIRTIKYFCHCYYYFRDTI